jgi:hypothetical protein
MTWPANHSTFDIFVCKHFQGLVEIRFCFYIHCIGIPKKTHTPNTYFRSFIGLMTTFLPQTRLFFLSRGHFKNIVPKFGNTYPLQNRNTYVFRYIFWSIGTFFQWAPSVGIYHFSDNRIKSIPSHQSSNKRFRFALGSVRKEVNRISL